MFLQDIWHSISKIEIFVDVRIDIGKFTPLFIRNGLK